MKELTRKLENLIAENKITQAFKSIDLFLSSNNILDSELFKLIEKVFENLKEVYILQRVKILEIAKNSNLEPVYFLERTLTLVSVEDLYIIYPIAKDIFLKNGRLESFDNLFKKYKTQLLKYKSFSILQKEVEDLQTLGIEDLLSIDEELVINFGLGDIEYFENVYLNALEKNRTSKISHLNIDFENIVWRKQSFVMKEKILSSRGSLDIEKLKELLKSIYELLIVNNESKQCLIELIGYSIQMSNQPMAIESEKYLKKIFNFEDKRTSNQIKNIVNIERTSYGDIDMGDDLFADETDQKDITIRRLVNQINILKVESDMEGATRLLEQLRDLDRDHSLVREIEEKEHRKQGSKLNKTSKTISEIENDILLELTKYTSKEKSLEDEQVLHLERVAKKSYELMDDEEILRQYRELLYTFNSLGFYSVSLSLIDRVVDLLMEGQLEQRIELTYLRCETLRMAQNYYGSLNEIEICLDTFALMEKEKVSFYYLKGEVLRELGRKREALAAYAKVYRLDKKFRMVSYRLKEIE
ncbi:hypothetical protein A9Q84_21445 [Halobacteriovorax marinus]|uniref:Uncharacterized protein n=1 Tax=Halobacteriovorax marinus TaxID=97084 RepID=A0A1Y5F7H8_9BACT|nr:hypothetical protein A9Q84_21445 [Halobacteriovorax marinus]